jgi:dipeptidyl-peptidase-4
MTNVTRLLLPCAVLVAVPALAAKEPPLDTSYLRRHAETRGFMLGRPVKPKFTPDGKAVLFLRAEARVPKMRLYEFDVASGKTKELLTPEALLKGAEEHLTPEEKARRERQRINVGGFTDYQLSEDGRLILVPFGGKLYTYDRQKGAVKELKTGKGTLLDPKFSPDGKKVAYVLDYDVYVYDLAKDKENRVTTGGTEMKPHGLAEFVAQEEMNRFSGYWWSPDSKSIAYQETDHDGVEVWYVSDPTKPEQPPSNQFYPRPGKKNAQVRLGIISIKGGKTTWVEWDRKKYEYLAQVIWGKHGPLTITLQDRKQQKLDLQTVDVWTGKVTEMRSVLSDNGWIDIDQSVPRWLPSGSYLFRNGNKLVYVPQFVGRQLSTLGNYRGLLSVDDIGREAAFLVTPRERASETQVWRVDMREDFSDNFGYLKQLTREPGQHTAVFAKDHSLYVLTSTMPAQMPRSTVHKADGTRLGELPSVAEEPPFKPNVTIEKVGGREGYFAAVVRPCNFDPKKQYPVIVDVYGGPHHQEVVAAMRNWLLPQWLADQGFIVVSIDNRGTPGRGEKWEHAIYQKFGSVPLEDQVAGLKALGKKHPEMDLKRVGIHGWSFGGYMSALAVLKRPDVYKAAVAGAPVTDWEDYDTHYTERYLGLLPESKKAYEEASLLPLASKLERPLLLVHGTADDNVYFRHTLRLSNALFRAGKDFELLPLPGLTHMVPDPVVTQRLHSRIARFFQTHLGKPTERK